MLPEQFTNRMKEMLKEEYEDFAACYGNDHAHSLRINPLKGTKEQYDQTSVFKQREPLKEQVAWEENGFYYEDSLQPGSILFMRPECTIFRKPVRWHRRQSARGQILIL